MFWLSTLGLLILGSVFVMFPQVFRSQIVDRDRGMRNKENITLYRGRVAELQDERDAGELDEIDFKNLLRELQRSLLRDADLEEEQQFPDTSSEEILAGLPRDSGYKTTLRKAPSRISKLVPLIALVLIPALAYSLYGKWGYYDDIQLSELFTRALHPSDDPQETTDLIMRLKDGVQQYPDNPWAWYFLGRNYSRLGMYDEAENSYREAIPYLGRETDQVMVMSQFVLASFLGAERQLTVEAKSMADRVLSVNPNDLTVLRILATEAREREDFQTAVQYWRRLVRANPTSSSARVYRSNIVAAEKILANGVSSATEVIENSPQIKVQVALADNLGLNPGQRVFVAVRDASRQGIPPLAVAQLTVADLPSTVLLDNSKAVGPFNLSSADTVFASALISQQGVANPQPGDFRAVSKPTARGEETIEISLLIAEKVR